jgi:enoyl-[acyl-carrier protein] reductase II
MLRIEHPVMLAGMGGVSYSKLTAAVSQAGGFGCLGAASMSVDQMVEEMKAVKAATRRPFGVDLLTALPGDLERQVTAAIGEGMSLFVAGLGIPGPVIDLCHDNGVLVGSMCGKVDHAVRAVDAGCDLVIAQGTEAGGHTGSVATMPLVPQIVDAVGRRVPVVAAGGIVDGRGLAAALALGADGVWVGTRFVATSEARTVPGYHEALLAAGEDSTVISRAFTGKTLRALRNGWTDYHETHPDEVLPFPAQAMRSISEGAMHFLSGGEGDAVDLDKECFPAGQGVGAITDVPSAAEVVEKMVSEAERTLRRIYTLTS